MLLLVASACFTFSETFGEGFAGANPFAGGGGAAADSGEAIEPAAPAEAAARAAHRRSNAAPGAPYDLDGALDDAVRGALAGYEGRYSVAIRRLSDGHETAIDGDRVFYSASLFKLAVLYEVQYRLTRGQLDLAMSLPIGAADIAEDDGTFWSLPFAEDGTISIGAALEAMVTVSDTTTANAFLHLLGHNQIDETLRSLGLKKTSVNDRKLPTTASDMALLMEALYLGRGLDTPERNLARDLLKAQAWRAGIPAGLPGNVISGNKTGNTEGATHDVAFVEAPGGTYVIAILSDRAWDWRPVEAVSAAVFAVLAAPHLRE